MGTVAPSTERESLQWRGFTPPIHKTPDAPYQRAAVLRQPEVFYKRDELETKISALEEKIRRMETRGIGLIKINLLPNKSLKDPLDAIIEPDDEGFIARTIDIPLYGYGDDPIEAVDALKHEIESLYDDLMEDDEFTDEWLKIKKFLRERIID